MNTGVSNCGRPEGSAPLEFQECTDFLLANYLALVLQCRITKRAGGRGHHKAKSSPPSVAARGKHHAFCSTSHEFVPLRSSHGYSLIHRDFGRDELVKKML